MTATLILLIHAASWLGMYLSWMGATWANDKDGFDALVANMFARTGMVIFFSLAIASAFAFFAVLMGVPTL